MEVLVCRIVKFNRRLCLPCLIWTLTTQHTGTNVTSDVQYVIKWQSYILVQNQIISSFFSSMSYHLLPVPDWLKSLKFFYFLFCSSRSYSNDPLLFDQRLYTSLCLSGILCEFMLRMQRSAEGKEDAYEDQCDWSIFPMYVSSSNI